MKITYYFNPKGVFKMSNFSIVRNFRSRSLRPIEGSVAALHADGAFAPVRGYYFFGSGPQGQLGIGRAGTDAMLGVPTQTLAPSGGKLKVGYNHCAHISDDELVLRTWGFNQTGQLGLSHRDEVNSPSIVSGIHGEFIKDVICGTFQTFVISENIKTGAQHVWQFGAGYVTDNPEKFTRHTIFPVKLNARLVFGDTKIKKIIPGNDFCFFIDENDKVYSLGDNDYGALGHGQELGDSETTFPRPTVIKAFDDIKVYDIEVGWNHALARTSNGIYSWGNNTDGECGIDKRNEKIYSPRKISFFEGMDIVQITSGSTHCMALDRSGSVFVWGSNNDGKLGINQETEIRILAPVHLDAFDGEKIVKVETGGEHSVALTDQGDVWAWGNGEYGQLSRYTRFKNAVYPVKLPSVSFGSEDSGNYERLGDVSAKDVWHLTYDHKITDIHCGASFTVLELTSHVKDEVKNVLFERNNIDQDEIPEENFVKPKFIIVSAKDRSVIDNLDNEVDNIKTLKKKITQTKKKSTKKKETVS